MTVRPITGMLRRHLITDLSVALSSGFIMGNVWWYGYHLPSVARRDQAYERIENERAQKRAERMAAAVAE